MGRDLRRLREASASAIRASLTVSASHGWRSPDVPMCVHVIGLNGSPIVRSGVLVADAYDEPSGPQPARVRGDLVTVRIVRGERRLWLAATVSSSWWWRRLR